MELPLYIYIIFVSVHLFAYLWQDVFRMRISTECSRDSIKTCFNNSDMLWSSLPVRNLWTQIPQNKSVAKVKEKRCPCNKAPHHEHIWGNGLELQRILNFGTRRKWVCQSDVPAALIPWERSSVALDMRLGDCRANLDALAMRKAVLCMWIWPRSSNP